MRIWIDAHYVGLRYGGNEQHFASLITHLANAQNGDAYFAFNYRLAAAGRLPEQVRLVRLRARAVAWQRGVEIPFHSQRLRLDVLHVPFNFLPVFRCRKVVTIHDLAFVHVPDAYGAIERLRMAALTRAAARRADHVCAVSAFARHDIAERYRVPLERITVTPNAVDRGVFRPLGPAPEADARRRLGLRCDFILFVGTLQPRKNVLTLLRAFDRLHRGRWPDLHLVLAGRRGWSYEPVFRFVRQRGLERAVHHLEVVSHDELVVLYNGARALVFPSLCEGFGIPILEAMSCGCPVVSANTSAMPEVYGDAALAFAPRDDEELAHQLERVLDDEALRGDLVRRGFRNCDRFSWARTAEIVRAVYHAL